MKSFLFCAAVAVLLTACGQSEDKSAGAKKASDVTPVSAPADYVGALGNAQNKAVKVTDIASINQAIQIYNATEGHYPKDLNELVSSGNMPRLPAPPSGMKYDYDASTGKVKAVPK